MHNSTSGSQLSRPTSLGAAHLQTRVQRLCLHGSARPGGNKHFHHTLQQNGSLSKEIKYPKLRGVPTNKGSDQNRGRCATCPHGSWTICSAGLRTKPSTGHPGPHLSQIKAKLSKDQVPRNKACDREMWKNPPELAT